MSFTFEIPGRLPGLNEIIDAARSHWTRSRDQKAEFTNLCAEYVVANRVPFFSKVVDVHFEWIEPNRRRDKDNVRGGSKFILDALAVTGRIQKDGWKGVGRLSDSYLVNKGNPRVRVTLEESENS